MRYKIVFVLTLFMLISCSSRQDPAPDSKVTEKTGPVLKSTKSVEKSFLTLFDKKTTEALWHLISPQEMSFVLKRERDSKHILLEVKTSLSSITLPEGEWSIVGIINAGETYRIPLGANSFRFQLEKDKSHYLGSYILQCPLVGDEYLPELRRMRFFNRYRFTAGDKHCELVIGDHLDQVSRAWSRLVNRPATELKAGF